MITSFIELRMGKLILNHLIGFVQSSATYFLKATFSNWLEKVGSHFQNHPGSVLLQKRQLLSNQSFKQNLAHMPSLNFASKVSFKPRFLCLHH